MSATAEVLLGVIAVAVALMAVVQVGAILAGLRVARRVEHLATELETGVKPLLSQLTTLTAEASKATVMAAGQVERFDRMLSQVVARLDDTLTAAQRLVSGPAREGLAMVAGLRATLAALQRMRDAAQKRREARATEEEEESLFIG